jgi:hypothetical protein
MNTKQSIFMILSVMLSLVTLAMGLYVTTNAETDHVNVPCYDRYQNQIQELTCTEDSITYPTPEFYI